MTEFADEPKARVRVPERQPASRAVDFAMGQLRLNPDLSYEDAKARAALAGFTLHFASYEGAKLRLGITKPRPPRIRRKRAEVERLAREAAQARIKGLEGGVKPAERDLPAGVTPIASGAPLSPSSMLRFARVYLERYREATFETVREDADRCGIGMTRSAFNKGRSWVGLPALKSPSWAGARWEDLPSEPRKAPQLPTGEGVPLLRTENKEPRRQGRSLGPVMLFVLEHLQASPRSRFKEVQAAATKAGLDVPYRDYHRARARLGLTKMRGSESGGSRPLESVAEPDTRTAPAPRQATGTGIDVGDLVRAIEELQAERDRLKTTLTLIAMLIKGVDA